MLKKWISHSNIFWNMISYMECYCFEKDRISIDIKYFGSVMVVLIKSSQKDFFSDSNYGRMWFSRICIFVIWKEESIK